GRERVVGVQDHRLRSLLPRPVIWADRHTGPNPTVEAGAGRGKPGNAAQSSRCQPARTGQPPLATFARSTYVDWMEDPRRWAAEAGAADPAVGLSAVAALRRLVEQLEALQVDNARAQGWRWGDIADRLGVSKQAVHRKHASRLRLLRG